MESKVTTFQISKHSHHHPTSRKVKSVQVHWFCHEKGRGGKPRADNAEVIFSSRAFSELQFSFLYYGFSQNYLHHNLVSNAPVLLLPTAAKLCQQDQCKRRSVLDLDEFISQGWGEDGLLYCQHKFQSLIKNISSAKNMLGGLLTF